MKSFQLFLFLFLFTMTSFAQQNHFIYIQTENKQAFYVKLGDRLLSSSSTGYLVIPKLQDGTYELNIGFPKNEWPVQKITVTIKNKDIGYVLKNFDSKGWGLFNMQTLDVIMTSGSASIKEPVKESVGDGFADVLADVVSTPSIKQKPVSKEIKEEKIAAVSKADPAVNMDSTAKVPVQKPSMEPLVPAVKLFSMIDTSGRAMVYVDTYEGKADTIRIFIPYKQVADIVAVSEKPVPPVEIVKKEESKPEPKTEAKQESKQDAKFLDMELANPNSKVDTAANKKTVAISEVSTAPKDSLIVNKDVIEPKADNANAVMINSDCKASATEEDFLKLRKKMAAETTDDDMITIAKKAFKSKCYSTSQVSNLSSLFLKDEGRYNFFDAAYPRVNDTHNFAGLVTKLSDEYYITRFKAMIRH